MPILKYLTNLFPLKTSRNFNHQQLHYFEWQSNLVDGFRKLKLHSRMFFQISKCFTLKTILFVNKLFSICVQPGCRTYQEHITLNYLQFSPQRLLFLKWSYYTKHFKARNQCREKIECDLQFYFWICTWPLDLIVLFSKHHVFL